MMNLNWMNQTSDEASDEAVYLEKLSNLLCMRGEKKCNNGPAQVLDHLYCGSRMDAHDRSLLRRLRITHVLNCAAGAGHDPNCVESPYKDDRSGVLRYMELDALDYPGYPIIRTHYRCAKTFIDEAKDSGGRALVHCELGVNRSAALCIAYSMEAEQMSLLRAVRQLQIDRPNILCNEGFRRQLIDFAKERNLLHPRRTCTFDQKATPVAAADDVDAQPDNHPTNEHRS